MSALAIFLIVIGSYFAGVLGLYFGSPLFQDEESLSKKDNDAAVISWLWPLAIVILPFFFGGEIREWIRKRRLQSIRNKKKTKEAKLRIDAQVLASQASLERDKAQKEREEATLLANELHYRTAPCHACGTPVERTS